MDKIRLDRPLVVEGRYDKNTVSQVAEGVIVEVGGFAVFHKTDLVAYLRRLSDEKGLLILTDSDGGGGQIRRYLMSVLPREKLTQLYIPAIPGKEKRKKTAGKAGLLGVEGMSAERLRAILAPYAADAPTRSALSLTKADLFALGLSGGENSARLRAIVAEALDLPGDLTADAFLLAVNTIVSPEDWNAALQTAGINQK